MRNNLSKAILVQMTSAINCCVKTGHYDATVANWRSVTSADRAWKAFAQLHFEKNQAVAMAILGLRAAIKLPKQNLFFCGDAQDSPVLRAVFRFVDCIVRLKIGLPSQKTCAPIEYGRHAAIRHCKVVQQYSCTTDITFSPGPGPFSW